MKIFKRILIVVGIILAIFIIIGLILPTEYEIKRTITIQADKTRIHSFVNDLTQWDHWEPWRSDNSGILITLGEITQGKGASQSWTIPDSGDGRLEFAQSDENGIAYDLYFNQDKYKCFATINYQASETNGNTLVTWTMQGDMKTPVMGGYLAIVMKSVNAQFFDMGLQKLKVACEQKQ